MLAENSEPVISSDAKAKTPESQHKWMLIPLYGLKPDPVAKIGTRTDAPVSVGAPTVIVGPWLRETGKDVELQVTGVGVAVGAGVGVAVGEVVGVGVALEDRTVTCTLADVSPGAVAVSVTVPGVVSV